jgi:glucosamine--fructose-6-phosphate aminotransferase (isomerizing)
MELMSPSVMIPQVKDLPKIMRDNSHEFDWGEMGVRRSLSPLEIMSANRVYVSGSGDSYHAALAAEMAFEEIGRTPCEPSNGMTFTAYIADTMPTPFPNDPLVIGISASGGSYRTIQLLEAAKANNANTLALTGTAGSPVTQVADNKIVVGVPDMGKSPGIRTYQASLMGLLLLAIRFGEIKGYIPQEEANGIRSELKSLADLVEATVEKAETPARELAKAWAESPMMMFLGSGPSYGTAMFSAAKVVEGAGVFAVAQDLEEWAHVERFCYPNDMPVYIVAPPGKSHWRAVEVAETAKSLGHRVAAVIQEGDDAIGQYADVVFPVPGEVREAFSPIVYHVASNFFASYVAEQLGRSCFQSDNADFWNAPASSARINVNDESDGGE